MDFALEVRGLHKTYKEFELKDISLQLPKGCPWTDRGERSRKINVDQCSFRTGRFGI